MRTIEFDGELRSVEDWARLYDMAPSTLYRRLHQGWTPFEAITTPTDSPGSSMSPWERRFRPTDDDYVPPNAGGYAGR